VRPPRRRVNRSVQHELVSRLLGSQCVSSGEQRSKPTYSARLLAADQPVDARRSSVWPTADCGAANGISGRRRAARARSGAARSGERRKISWRARTASSRFAARGSLAQRRGRVAAQRDLVARGSPRGDAERLRVVCRDGRRLQTDASPAIAPVPMSITKNVLPLTPLPASSESSRCTSICESAIRSTRGPF